jgi:hypothetical protein
MTSIEAVRQKIPHSDLKLVNKRNRIRDDLNSIKSVIKNNNQRAGRGSDLINPTAERNFLSSMQCTGRCLVGQLDDPAPCYLAVVIVTRGDLVTRFSIRGDGAPDVDLGYQGSPAPR